MSMYPPSWPKCVSCGDDALDGHLTCGRVGCDEQRARYGMPTCPDCGRPRYALHDCLDDPVSA